MTEYLLRLESNSEIESQKSVVMETSPLSDLIQSKNSLFEFEIGVQEGISLVLTTLKSKVRNLYPGRKSFEF